MLAVATRYEKGIPPPRNQVNQGGSTAAQLARACLVLLQSKKPSAGVTGDRTHSMHSKHRLKYRNYSNFRIIAHADFADSGATLSTICYS
jgi:hypothetical protein